MKGKHAAGCARQVPECKCLKCAKDCMDCCLDREDKDCDSNDCPDFELETEDEEIIPKKGDKNGRNHN